MNHTLGDQSSMPLENAVAAATTTTTTTAAAAMDDGDDMRRRRHEMSVFAAMAAPPAAANDTGMDGSNSLRRWPLSPATPKDRNKNHQAAVPVPPSLLSLPPVSFSSSSPSPAAATATAANLWNTLRSSSQEQQPDNALFSERSFAVTEGDDCNANLSAAVAALSKADKAQSNTTGHSSSHSKKLSSLPTTQHQFRTDNPRPDFTTASEDDCMFAELVVFHRPLFFGAIVSPRVLQGAKDMIVQAVKAKQAEQHSVEYHPRLHELPDAVRNVVGALRAHGFGLEKQVLDEPFLHSLNLSTTTTNSSSSSKRTSFRQESKTGGTSQWRGDGTVSTFQPVWGSDVRAERVKEYKAKRKPLHKPTVVARVSTAPPRMVGPSDDDDEDDDDDDDVETDEARLPPPPPPPPRPLTGPPKSDVAKSTHPVTVQDSENEDDDEDDEDDPNVQFTAWLMRSVEDEGDDSSVAESPLVPMNRKRPVAVVAAPKALSEQEIFSKWVLGSTSGDYGTLVGNNNKRDTMRSLDNTSANANQTNPFNGSTFQRLSPKTENDDDSLIDDEQNTEVGANDNLSKAVCMFSDENNEAMDVVPLAEQSQVLLSQVDGSRKRPLTNFELTGGYIPLFAADDAALPHESDLGIHETKEEQRRSFEQKRSQEIIEKFVPHNVFGPIACPNPAVTPDDFHSWNSRVMLSPQCEPLTTTSVASDPSGLKARALNAAFKTNNTISAPPRPPSTGSKPSRQRPRTPKETSKQRLNSSRQLFGWWNDISDLEDESQENQQQQQQSRDEKTSEASKDDETEDPSLQLPPIHHSSSVVQVLTPLDPTPESLKEDNLPLSRMHAATSMAQTLPFLSDRPPSFRYLQIDTQQIAFPPLEDEIEPLFCSLAIYNVETISSGMSTGAQSPAPIPDLQRCGRVTEALHFDQVTSQDVETRCAASLWPYSKTSQASEVLKGTPDKLRGTTCGIFPLPSNLNISNLYAVLIVRKVLSEESDFDPYLKPRKPLPDIDKLKANAEKASKNHGGFVVPFAFGVVPLLQVFGIDNILVASSRAVQIPLFHFSEGERQIIDHIMVMLFPRADHKANGIGGPAPVTNGGTAMLVMRNFGYLGLHAVVDTKSSLARHRVVDFTGDLQLRRRAENDDVERKGRRVAPDNFRVKLPSWHPQCVAEPTLHGGRIHTGPTDDDGCLHGVSDSKLYAQELAALPLMLTPSSRMSSGPQAGIARVNPSQDDIEPFYHTTFCNELICQPRILHNCPQGHFAIKVELREMEWNETHNVYFAHVPRPSIGPCIHNARRGPFLVQSSFTSCSSRRGDHHFIDDFKIKLPLDMNPRNNLGKSLTLSLFFTVYRMKTGNKSLWSRGAKKLFGSTLLDSLGGDEVESSGRTEQVASGFLPLTAQSCLVDNGMYDIRVNYTAVSPSAEMCDEGIAFPSSVMLIDQVDSTFARGVLGRNESFADDTIASNDSFISDQNRDSESGVQTGSNNTTRLANDESSPKGTKVKGIKEPIALSIRIVAYSSLHVQNTALSELLNQESDLPLLSYGPNKIFMATLRMGRDYLNTQSSHQSRISRVRENKILESIVTIADLQLCSMSKLTTNLVRVLSILWRALICGDGEPDLAWANPATSTPLRVHSFATILHLVGTTSLFMAKCGVTQLDGVGKFNFSILGRALALIFDERKIFGQQAIEKFDEQYWFSPAMMGTGATSPTSKKSPPKRRGHVRQTFELGNDVGPITATSTISNFPSTAGDLATIVQPDRTDYMGLPWNFEIEFETSGSQVPPKPDLKLDTKSDFQSFLRAAEASYDEEITVSASSRTTKEAGTSVTSKPLIHAYSSLAVSSNRRYMTVPASLLPTILEQGDDTPQNTDGTGASQETLFRVRDRVKGFAGEDQTTISQQPPSKQMRRPRVSRGGSLDLGKEKQILSQDMAAVAGETGTSSFLRNSASEDDVKSMGDAFLDKLCGWNLGASPTVLSRDGEQKHVGSSHHRRRTQGRSSIDWSLIDEESTSPTPSGSLEDSTSTDGALYEYDERMSTLKKEESSAVKLPNFVDRLVVIGNVSSDSARWFPFAYEVIIMQWAAFLMEQRKAGDKAAPERLAGLSDVNEDLHQAAMRSIGVAVAGSPMLFEIIKQSLGFRIKSLFDTVLAKKSVRDTPPLVTLDDTLMMNLVQVISMLTDACIDSRNFDSWDARQMSIDVNDAIVRFLRDLFSFLSPACVHRLVLAYFSRFLTKDGKNFSDRDSLVGLRCSWEITKLRLNAVTAFIRFPDFVKVNGPQMLNWTSWWTGAPPPRASAKFFDDVLERYRRFQLSEFVVSERGVQKAAVFPSMRPHWFAEIIVDICLLGTEHAEQYIQNRSASLLHEMLWFCSQESFLHEISSPVASMFVSLIEKLVSHASYFAVFLPKTQLRKDVLISCTFVLQSAAPNLLRALWRRLCNQLPGKGDDQKYCSLRENGSSDDGNENEKSNICDGIEEPDILGMFGLLNVAIRSLEYEGSDHVEADGSGDNRDSIEVWRKEYLLCKYPDGHEGRRNDEERNTLDTECTSSISRKWQAHDGSMVIINAAHQIVMELYSMLSKSSNGKSLLNPALRSNGKPGRLDRYKQSDTRNDLLLSSADTTIFVRAATSLYLHALALRTSDIVVAKTFIFTSELLKIFGVKVFLNAVGETLQHWLRVISLHCGGRRSMVRIEATDLLELILRSTWEAYGSFFRIRVPLLAVQTEVMERIVATAAARYYRDQRRLGTNFETFTILGAEASLTPLYRTLDRIQKKPASQHVAFRGALVRIAGKLKKLYRAYVAARVLSFIKSSRDKTQEEENLDSESRDYDDDARVRASRISMLRVINASEGHSKQFLGFQGTSQLRNSVAHYEAVEDALIAAANVFSPTELPEHRVAWLRMLSDFHRSRKNYAEEATCHYYIHVTLHLAARLHGSLWSNTPFLPWTDNIPDPIVYIDSDAAPAADPDCSSESNFDDWDYSGHTDQFSFRRLFYRVSLSVAAGNNEWESGESKTQFFGISFASEYEMVAPWMTLRDMEESMVEEVEAAGLLFLKAGIVESCRFAWNRATQYYSEKFNYAKLAIVYGNLSRAVVSQVPSIDTSLPQEVLTTLGRFYRVWFHGGAPDDLNGVEFVYRSLSRLKEFGEELRSVILSILPSNTPIHLVLDGPSEEVTDDTTTAYSSYRVGPTPIETVRIKVTPLRPLFDTYVRTRGVPEWFHRYVSDVSPSRQRKTKSDFPLRGSARRFDSIPTVPVDGQDPHHVYNRSHNATMFSSVGSSVGTAARGGTFHSTREADRMTRFAAPREGDLSGVDKFCFVQPKNRSKPNEWWKASSGDFAEKSLRVTQLQVAQSFPACVARQVVAHRLVYSQSPLEAGIDSVCQWCAILFRTAVATTGMAVLKSNYDPGIGTDSAKVVADCIHNSHVKEIGIWLLSTHAEKAEHEMVIDFSLDSGRLSKDEIAKLQLKLARLIIIFVELLHLLVGRNRDMLLDVIQDRKKNEATASVHGGSASRGVNRIPSGLPRKTTSAGPSPVDTSNNGHKRNVTDGSRSEGVRSDDARVRQFHHAQVGSEDNQSYHSMMTSSGVRTDSAIAVQSELQRAFISLTKALFKNVNDVLKDETPRWFKQSGQENYFSLGSYRQTKIPIAEELCFTAGEAIQSETGSHHPFTHVPSLHSEHGYESPRGGSVGEGSQTSVVSRGSERYGFGQF